MPRGSRPYSVASLPDRGDAGRNDLLGRPGHEDAFCVASCESAPGGRRSGLVEYRRALRRRLAQVQGVELIVRPIVLNPTHALGSREDTAFGVGDDRIVSPAAFPQLIDDLHVVFCDSVALVMWSLPVVPRPLRRAVEIAGHHVPPDPAVGQMIERRHSPREGKRRFIGKCNRDPGNRDARSRRPWLGRAGEDR